jgi:DMSO/TMAO reductase YedYZ molybdopterin-dependent catalytic subunit
VVAVFTGRDKGIEGGEIQHYQRSLSVADAMFDNVLLAYEMNGNALLPQHGAPLRLIVPGWYGMTSVKWLDRIEAIDHAFNGYQMQAYTFVHRDSDTIERVSLQRVRSLIIPPGIPDFLTRSRVVECGAIALTGRAWAGRRSVASVQVSIDGGETWRAATLGQPVGQYAWCMWSIDIDVPSPCILELCSRATDCHGDTQPFVNEWNRGGFANNSIQVIRVHVVAALPHGARLLIPNPRL